MERRKRLGGSSFSYLLFLLFLLCFSWLHAAQLEVEAQNEDSTPQTPDEEASLPAQDSKTPRMIEQGMVELGERKQHQGGEEHDASPDLQDVRIEQNESPKIPNPDEVQDPKTPRMIEQGMVELGEREQHQGGEEHDAPSAPQDLGAEAQNEGPKKIPNEAPPAQDPETPQEDAQIGKQQDAEPSEQENYEIEDRSPRDDVIPKEETQDTPSDSQDQGEDTPNEEPKNPNPDETQDPKTPRMIEQGMVELGEREQHQGGEEHDIPPAESQPANDETKDPVSRESRIQQLSNPQQDDSNPAAEQSNDVEVPGAVMNADVPLVDMVQHQGGDAGEKSGDNNQDQEDDQSRATTSQWRSSKGRNGRSRAPIRDSSSSSHRGSSTSRVGKRFSKITTAKEEEQANNDPPKETPQREAPPPPKRPSVVFNFNETAPSDIFLTVIIHVHQEKSIFLRNSLSALYSVFSSELPNEKLEIILIEIGSLPIAQRFARRDGILLAIEPHQRKGKLISILGQEDFGTGFSLSQGTNHAVSQAKGKYILLLHEKTEILPGFFEMNPLLQKADDPSIGIVGSKLIRGDGMVFYAGIGYAITSVPKQATDRSYYWWDKDDKSDNVPKSTPLPFYICQGHSAFDLRTSDQEVVAGLSSALLLFKRQTFYELQGLSEDLSDGFTFLDFCLRLSTIANKKVIFSPNSQAMYFGEDEDWSNRDSIRAFSSIWDSYLRKQIVSNYVIHNFTLIWNMECGKGAVLGFTSEAIGIVTGLEHKLPLKIQVSDINGCIRDMKDVGVPESTLKALQRLEALDAEGDSILVVHRDPGRYNSFIDGPHLYTIGRSMYETDRIPDDWINKCNTLVDKIWVPSHFNVETFARSGVDRALLDVVPEAVDTHAYDPTVVQPIQLPRAKGFNFLTVMKWETRKAWDTLLKAYFQEFSQDDDVSLYIRSSIDDRNEKEYKTFVEEEFPNQELPQVVFLKEPMPFTKLPSLYKAADCIVLASHGEGWGLPLIEGMSMGLPAIATNWSGNTEFMTAENSYLVEVEEMVEAPLSGHYWAQPSLKGLKEAMRQVYQNHVEALQRGRKGRQDVIEHYSQDCVAKIILEKIKWLENPDVKQQLQVERTRKEAERAERQRILEEKRARRNSIKIND